ncbi:MAG: DUF3073 domain-containing protein [Actinomycetales bacterium]|nr:DUF3073 domain-containing protein [Actinomycetales bacterium]
MGRGRAKAKQTKVARRLKYYSPETDLNALARELGATGDTGPDDALAESPEDELDEDDAYERWASSEN